jgi:hypothetical protein
MSVDKDMRSSLGERRVREMKKMMWQRYWMPSRKRWKQSSNKNQE